MIDALISSDLLDAIKAHATQCAPRECCGLIITHHRKKEYRPCRNIGTQNEHFVLHAEDYAAAEDAGMVLAIVHSHVAINPHPSQADMVGMERSGLPWVIVNHPLGTYTVNAPSGYIAPLLGREFSHGVLDCLQLITDYYQHQLGITIPYFERQDEWWLKGQDLYRDNMAAAGFVEVPIENMREHDVILMQVACPVENHGAIYLGNNRILHHVMQQISCESIYGGWWRKITTGVIRHKAFL